MGVNTVIRLPDNVQVRDVAIAIGILAGKEPQKVVFDAKEKAWYTKVKEVSIQGIKDRPGCAWLIVEGLDRIQELYHFEGNPGRLLMPHYSGFWTAMGKRLVDLFGGTVDYNDCDNIRVDYSVPEQSCQMATVQEKRWYDLEQVLYDLSPITEEEIKACEELGGIE